MDAAGSDTRGKYRLSGMATPVGMVYNKSEKRAVERKPCNLNTCRLHDNDWKTAK